MSLILYPAARSFVQISIITNSGLKFLNLKSGKNNALALRIVGWMRAQNSLKSSETLFINYAVFVNLFPSHIFDCTVVLGEL